MCNTGLMILILNLLPLQEGEERNLGETLLNFTKQVLDRPCTNSAGGTSFCTFKWQICCPGRAGNPCCDPNQEANCCGGGTNPKAPSAPNPPSGPSAPSAPSKPAAPSAPSAPSAPASTGRQSDDKSSARKVFGSLQFQCVTLSFAFLFNIVM